MENSKGKQFLLEVSTLYARFHANLYKKTKGRLILMIEFLKKVHNKVELETR